MLLLPFLLIGFRSFVTKSFDEIRALTTDVITFFGSSKELTDAQREIINAVSAAHNSTFFIDKDDESNKKIFDTPDLRHLPALYVLIYEELNAEKYTGEFTLADIMKYIEYKFAPYNESLVDPGETLSNIKKRVDNGTNVGAAVLFVSRKKCTACPSTAISILRSATRLHAENVPVQYYALNCDDMLKECGETHIDRVPTFAVYSNGIWTQYAGAQVGTELDAFVKGEIKADDETMKRRQEEQAKNIQRFNESIKKAEEQAKKIEDPSGHSIPNTATRSRMLALEKRVAALEKKLEKAKGKKGKSSEKEL